MNDYDREIKNVWDKMSYLDKICAFPPNIILYVFALSVYINMILDMPIIGVLLSIVYFYLMYKSLDNNQFEAFTIMFIDKIVNYIDKFIEIMKVF